MSLLEPVESLARTMANQGTAAVDHLSYSAVSSFQRCPLRCYFRYVLRLPETPTSSALVFGGAIHSAVERYFRELLAGQAATE